LATDQLLVITDKNSEWMTKNSPEFIAVFNQKEEVPEDITKLLAA